MDMGVLCASWNVMKVTSPSGLYWNIRAFVRISSTSWTVPLQRRQHMSHPLCANNTSELLAWRQTSFDLQQNKMHAVHKVRL